MQVVITKEKLMAGVSKGIITGQQGEELWKLFSLEGCVEEDTRENITNESAFVKMLYYSGTVIIMGAMGWFMNKAWDSWYGAGIAGITLLYAVAFISIGRAFTKKSAVVKDLFYIMAVAMTPLFTYGIQKWLGIWPGIDPGGYQNFHMYIKGGWMVMELSTLLIGTLALRYVKIPFGMAIPAFILWYISMDITPLLFGQDHNWGIRKYISIVFGMLMISIGFSIDNKKKVDYSKWLYIFGGISFWGGLSSLTSSNEWSKFVYFIINSVMMGGGTLLQRKVFIIFGSLGCIGYVGHLAYSVFQDSALFPFVLVGFGLSIVFNGWFCHKYRENIRKKLVQITPQFIINKLPNNRGQA